MDRRRLTAGALALGCVAVAALLAGPEAALARLSQFADRPVAFGAALLALAAVRPLFAWPTSILPVAVGYAYGAVGMPFALALLTLTGVPPYLFSRTLGLEGRVAAAERFVDSAGDVRSVAAARLLPAPSDVVSAGAAVAGVRLRPYLIGTAVGEAPWAIAGVLVGASLGRLVGGTDAGVLAFDPLIFAGFAVVAVLLVAGPTARRLVSR